jgi:hypothetical protein
LTHTSRKHSRLKDAEEEATRQQATVAAHNTHHDGDKAEHEHVGGQPDMGLEALEENVGGDLKETVGHEEDDQSGVVLECLQAKLG